MGEIDILFSSGDQKNEEFEFKGRKVNVTIRELGWTEKNKIISSCFHYQQDGTIKFDFDKYNREMLRKMVLGIGVNGEQVPQGSLNETFFTRLSASAGGMLEKLVPKAFEDIGTGDFFVRGSNNLSPTKDPESVE